MAETGPAPLGRRVHRAAHRFRLLRVAEASSLGRFAGAAP
jgi:hypothetical protein